MYYLPLFILKLTRRVCLLLIYSTDILQDACYQTLDVLQEHGISANDIQKLQSGGYNTIQSVRKYSIIKQSIHVDGCVEAIFTNYNVICPIYNTLRRWWQRLESLSFHCHPLTLTLTFFFFFFFFFLYEII